MPYSRYHGFEPQKVDMECGAPLGAPAAGEGRIVAGELPGGQVATTWHIGPYDGLSAAYDALMGWAGEQARVPAGGPWEIYHTGPDEVPDPAQWRTELFLPLA
jgi:effector-binding domain-containing protein